MGGNESGEGRVERASGSLKGGTRRRGNIQRLRQIAFIILKANFPRHTNLGGEKKDFFAFTF